MSRLLVTILMFLALAGSGRSRGAILYESSSLGTTQVPRIDVGTQTVLGLSIRDGVYNGARFQLNHSVVTTSVGGHFVGPFGNEDTFFGAVIQLTHEEDFPDSSNLSTPDVLGTALLSFPSSSSDVRGELELTLHPGWYAVVFGGGLFGAEGRGAAVRNNPGSESASYINWQANSPGNGWTNLITFPVEPEGKVRFFVEGTIVPEPASVVFSALAAIPIGILRNRSIESR